MYRGQKSDITGAESGQGSIASKRLNPLKILRFRDHGDWRTLALVLLVHGLIAGLVFVSWDGFIGDLQAQSVFMVLMLAPLVTLYSSLTHEITHGHPFRSSWVNDLLMVIPYGLLVPHYRFKDTHLAHHKDVNLCDPYDDPESWYQLGADWHQRGPISQAVFNFNNTLLGRMLIGPLIGMTGFIKCDWYNVKRGERHIAGKWLLHLALCAVLLSAVAVYSPLPVWCLPAAAYLGMSILMIRTYLEHQAHEKVRGRSVIIEKGGIFAFLFLNNSLHAVHHAYPAIAWYRLPGLFAANRNRFLKMNDGYAFGSYRSVFRQFFFRRKEPVPIEDALDKRD